MRHSPTVHGAGGRSILGALLALPIAAGIQMIVDELRVDLPGEGVKHTEILEKDEEGEKEFERRAAGVPAAEAAAIAIEIAEVRREEDAGDPPPTAGSVASKESS